MTVEPADSEIPGELRAAETCWPLAGSPEFERLPARWRSERADRLQADLQRHAIDAWFPRSIDFAGGGFLCDFDGRWRARGSQVRMLEFQARQTRTTARLGQAFPADRRWVEWTTHGIRFLHDVMRDTEDGGWFWLINYDGSVQAQGSKHSHSTAYLIGAYVEAHRLTGDLSALHASKEAFRWLDAVFHDKEHGGYRTWATRDGRPILNPTDMDLPEDAKDPMGHDVGLKDANVHSDLLESLRLLYEDWPDPVLRDRLVELYDIMLEKHGKADGSMHYVLNDDLTPVHAPEHFGYPPQSGSRIVRVAPLIGRSPDEAWAWARMGINHVLQAGRHPDGRGIVNEAPPAHAVRPWWVQTEMLQVIAMLATHEPDSTEIAGALDGLMAFVVSDFLDVRNGGWHPRARSDWPIGARLRSWRVHKGDRWKDASHEVDMYLTNIRILRGLDALAPLF